MSPPCSVPMIGAARSASAPWYRTPMLGLKRKSKHGPGEERALAKLGVRRLAIVNPPWFDALDTPTIDLARNREGLGTLP